MPREMFFAKSFDGSLNADIFLLPNATNRRKAAEPVGTTGPVLTDRGSREIRSVVWEVQGGGRVVRLAWSERRKGRS